MSNDYSQYRHDSHQPVPEQPHSRPWLRLLIWMLILGGIGFAVYHFWPEKKVAKGAPPVVVKVTPAARQDVPVYLDGLGTIQAFNTVTVYSEVTGTIEKILFHEGQTVKAGDQLAQIDPRTFQAAYDAAVATRDKDAATLANARVDLTRYENLGEAVAQQVLATQQATVKQLEATVESDEANIKSTAAQLSYTRITSPIAGRTGIRQIDVGNLVQPSGTTGIVVVTQLQPISVLFSLPQQDLEQINTQLNALQPGQKLAVLAVGSDNKTVIDQGWLELVDNEIDQTTGTIRLKSTFANPKNMLWPGGFVNVRLMVSTEQNALVLPSVAVQRGPQGTYVFALQPDQTVKIRPVTVERAQDDISIISGGIQDGEQIVIDGMIKLQDGSKVALSGQKKDDAAAPKSDDKKSSDDEKKHKHKDKDQGTEQK